MSLDSSFSSTASAVACFIDNSAALDKTWFKTLCTCSQQYLDEPTDRSNIKQESEAGGSAACVIAEAVHTTS
ncbi:hypothetical protein J6590_107346, partial [Homalodisca vitripennis]